jgi:uncharacterized integral membrane protein
MRKFRLKPIGNLRFFQKPVKVEKPFEWMPFLKSLPLTILIGGIILTILTLIFAVDWLLSRNRNMKE